MIFLGGAGAYSAKQGQAFEARLMTPDAPGHNFEGAQQPVSFASPDELPPYP